MRSVTQDCGGTPHEVPENQNRQQDLFLYGRERTLEWRSARSAMAPEMNVG